MTPRRRPRRSPLPWDAIHPTLDLHGHTADEARERADRWLREQQLARERTVRIVTGRGLHSVGQPVLRGEILTLLDRLKKNLVSGWESDSGGGALRIQLKRRRRAAPADPTASAGGSGTPRRSAEVPDDPELRRAAEESLADLGISPTPELLRAEMLRLRRGGGG